MSELYILRLSRVRDLWARLEAERPDLRGRLVEAACWPPSVLSEDEAGLGAVQALQRFVDAHTPLADGLDRKAVAADRAQLLHHLMVLAEHHASDAQVLGAAASPPPWETEAGRRLFAHLQAEESGLLAALHGFRGDVAAAFFDETYQACRRRLVKSASSAPAARNMNGDDLTAMVMFVIRFAEQEPPLKPPTPCLPRQSPRLWWSRAIG